MASGMDQVKKNIITITISDSEDDSDRDSGIPTSPRPTSASSEFDVVSANYSGSGSSSPQALLSTRMKYDSDYASSNADEFDDKCMDTDCNSTSAAQDPYSNYLHFCMHRSEGCEETLRITDMKDHLKICPFKPIFPCFLDQNKDSCSWKRKGSARPRGLLVLAEHFQEDHQVLFLSVSTIDFSEIVTLPCYSADTGIQQTTGLPSFVVIHIFRYEGTMLLLAVRHFKDHVVLWLWDLEDKWVKKRNLQLLCRLSTPKGAVSEPDWSAHQDVQDIVSEPKLEPLNVELDMDGRVVLPTKASNGVVTFSYRDIYDCGIVPWVKSKEVDQFLIKLDLF